MIDPHDIHARPDAYQKAADDKRIAVRISDILALGEQRKTLLRTVEDMRSQRNEVSDRVPRMTGAEKKAAISEMKALKAALEEKEAALSSIEERWNAALLRVPAIPDERVPVGKDDSENVQLRVEGTLPSFDFSPRDHVTIGEELDIVDIPRAVKIAGSRTYFLKGDGARLELAVLLFTLDHLRKKGYTPFIPPLLVNWEAMMGTSYFPGGEEQAYAVGVRRERSGPVEADGAYLIGTSEVSVTSYHADEVLSASALPKRYCGISNCFRREAGTYGKDTRGLYRIHQFQKVEQVILCANDPEVSRAMHSEILTNAEEVLKALELPYRVVAVCTGDMGQGQVYKNDIETWMPSRNGYGETHSCSTFHDFQSRRLNIKYVDEATGEKKFVHTLNNTCIASPRILIPILEIYQNADGSVTVPEVLRPYMGGQDRIGKKAVSAYFS